MDADKRCLLTGDWRYDRVKLLNRPSSVFSLGRVKRAAELIYGFVRVNKCRAVAQIDWTGESGGFSQPENSRMGFKHYLWCSPETVFSIFSCESIRAAARCCMTPNNADFGNLSESNIDCERQPEG